ncbi:31-O-demethyl-FK506 methyltransferase FkbM [bacterium HR30]|nr:31-O-demethyl-FK506 methyltransferase FkbM [bacterium HR30]
MDVPMPIRKVRPLKALRALRYAWEVVNWTDVFRAYWVDGDVQRLVLRNGVEFRAHGSVPLMGLYNEVWRHDCYRVRRPPLQPEATVLDIGANVGVFALYVAKEFRPRVVYCFEPSPVAAADLWQNARASELAGRVQVFPLAVAAREGEQRLALTRAEVLNRLVPATTSDEQTIWVRCTTLEQIFTRNSIERCDLLKIDCEGAEYDIVLTASESVLRRVRRMAIEWHAVPGHSPQELVERLQSIGFRVQQEGDPGGKLGYVYAHLPE